MPDAESKEGNFYKLNRNAISTVNISRAARIERLEIERFEAGRRHADRDLIRAQEEALRFTTPYSVYWGNDDGGDPGGPG